MKKFILSTLLLALPLFASAYDCQVDGIYYNLIPKGNVAKVTYQRYDAQNSPYYFSDYSGLVVIPEKFTYEGMEYTVTSIEEYAFRGCTSLTSVTIPNSVTSIGDGAFSKCSGLTSVTIPSSVTSIGGSAFENCSGLTSVAIPNSVISIGGGTFYGCTGLTSVIIGNSVTSIGNAAFRNCSGLTTVNIPNSVTSIGFEAFRNCSGLTFVLIGNSVTSIGYNAFFDCRGLTSVTIPNSVTSIGYGAFRNCDGLTSVFISDLSKWCNIDFGDSGSNPVYYAHHLYLNNNEITNLKIPNGITTLKDNVFCGCINLTSVTIPNSVTSIGQGAFYDCSGLTSVTIPNSVTSIEYVAFYGCSGLTSVTIGNSVTFVGQQVFFRCSSLKNVTIGSSVRNIYSQAFAECTKLEEVYCLAEEVPSTSTVAFDKSYPEFTTLYVPAASLNDYKTTEPWSMFGTIKAISGSGTIPEINKCATPSISYSDKQLNFSCETDGVEYVSEIKISDAQKFYDSSINLAATYEISVYATKTGYENSDIATATLVWTNATFTETTETSTSAKAVTESIPVLISANEGIITVKSEVDGQKVEAYGVNGQALGSATVQNGQATISTPMQRGEIVIVKVGNRSVKIKAHP